MTKNNMIRDDAPLLNDYVFKRTFTKGEPNGILKDFLESILDMN